MASQIAIVLFRTLGTAEDARNRLLQRGEAERDLDLRRLTKDTTVPPEATPQTMFSCVDWVLGNDPTERYGSYVRNGEMVLCIRARTDGELTATVETMRDYAPIRVDRPRAPEGAPP